MALTDLLAQRLLNALIQQANDDSAFDGFRDPPPLFLAAHSNAQSTTPNDDGTGFTEPSPNGTNYARVPLAGAGFGSPAVAGAGTNTIANDALIQFDQATGSWGSITHVGLFDAANGGSLLFHAQLSGGAVVIDANDRLAFQIGDLQFSIT